jgi:hypothetical protein
VLDKNPFIVLLFLVHPDFDSVVGSGIEFFVNIRVLVVIQGEREAFSPPPVRNGGSTRATSIPPKNIKALP